MNNIIVWDSKYCNDFFLAEKYENIKIFNDVEYIVDLQKVPQAILSSSKKKIVIVNWWQFADDSYNTPKSNFCLDWADLIICHTDELISANYTDFFIYSTNKLKNLNCIFIANGNIQNDSVEFKDRFFVDTQAFLSQVVYANTYQEVNVYKKQFLFDFLPGLKKTHREFVFNNLRLSGLIDKSIVSIYNVDGINQKLQWGFDYQTADLEKNDLEEFFKIKSNNKISSTASDIIKYKNGLSVWSSCLVPWEIYKNSYYSIVTETNVERHNFVTEKTAKPLLAKRLFVMFSSQYHLATLKDWGYKTFDDVIDESYDLEPDYNKRMHMAWQQVEYLATLDPNEVLDKLRPVFEHNHRLILDRASVYHKIKDFITSFIPK